MDHNCYRCGSQVEDQTPFCPSCGAPQIRVPVRETEPEVVHESVPPPPAPAGQVAAATVQTFPGQIHWKTFLRIILPLAAAAGIVSAFLGIYGWLLLSGAVFFCVRRYRRARPGPLAASQGAKMGVAAALLSCGFFAVLFAGQVAANPTAMRADIDRAYQRMGSLNLDPERVRMAQDMVEGTRGLVVFTIMYILMTLVFQIILSSAAGALSAGLARDPSP